MKIIELIEKESTQSFRQIIFMALISGFANSLLLAFINHGAEAVSKQEDLTQYFLLYLIAFILFLYCQWIAFDQASQAIENSLYNVKTRLTHKIPRVELGFMEKMGSNNLYARLTRSDTLISQSIAQITGATQMFLLLVFTFFYLAYISPISFLIFLITCAISVMLFSSRLKMVKKALQEVAEKENNYFKSISHLINGFKEVKINKNKSAALLKHITQVSAEASAIKIEVGKQESKSYGFGKVFIYAILPILIFIIPKFSEEHANDIFKISSVMLFIMGPITVMVNVFPLFNRVNLAIGELMKLEEEMDQAISEEFDNDENSFADFREIKIDRISFSYPATHETPFSAGPFSETVTRGELLFIIGGNGSGKSTFLKLLTGLYYPDGGKLYVDSTATNPADYSAYRSLFSVIFTDFHLFDKFYGVANLNAEKVNHWLKKMEMQHKVKYVDGGFTSTNLSTGQRKRLALIIAMLEDTPILVLDEFAADQDPQFRKYFYETLLMELKNSGKTIIAVTHDDHYFHVADRVLKMDEGRLEPYDAKILNPH
jgi:putative ATP-binding cassette transporter